MMTPQQRHLLLLGGCIAVQLISCSDRVPSWESDDFVRLDSEIAESRDARKDVAVPVQGTGSGAVLQPSKGPPVAAADVPQRLRTQGDQTGALPLGPAATDSRQPKPPPASPRENVSSQQRRGAEGPGAPGRGPSTVQSEQTEDEFGGLLSDLVRAAAETMETADPPDQENVLQRDDVTWVIDGGDAGLDAVYSAISLLHSPRAEDRIAGAESLIGTSLSGGRRQLIMDLLRDAQHDEDPRVRLAIGKALTELSR